MENDNFINRYLGRYLPIIVIPYYDASALYFLLLPPMGDIINILYREILRNLFNEIRHAYVAVNKYSIV